MGFLLLCASACTCLKCIRYFVSWIPEGDWRRQPWQNFMTSLNALNKLPNSADELCENAECWKCLTALRESSVQTKIKCHRRALGQLQVAFSQPRKPLGKASVLPFPEDVPKPTQSELNIHIRNYYTPQNMIILPLWAMENRHIKSAKHAARAQFWVEMSW